MNESEKRRLERIERLRTLLRLANEERMKGLRGRGGRKAEEERRMWESAWSKELGRLLAEQVRWENANG